MFNVQINHLTVLKKLDQIKNGDCKDGERSGSGVEQVHVHLCISYRPGIHLIAQHCWLPFPELCLNVHLIVVELGHHESEFFLGVEAGELLAHLQGDHQQLSFFKYFEYGQKSRRIPKLGADRSRGNGGPSTTCFSYKWDQVQTKYDIGEFHDSYHFNC